MRGTGAEGKKDWRRGYVEGEEQEIEGDRETVPDKEWDIQIPVLIYEQLNRQYNQE